MTIRKPRIVGDRVLVRIKKDTVDRNYRLNSNTGKYEEVSESGFVISTLSKDDVENLRLGTQEAHVVQIGEDAFIGLGSGHNRANLGDLVSVVRWSGEILPDIGDGEIYRIISDEDILVVWEGENIDVK